jgi:hypothetical protein
MRIGQNQTNELHALSRKPSGRKAGNTPDPNLPSYGPKSGPRDQQTASTRNSKKMHLIIPIAAVGYSLIYLLFGGGLGGAVLIYIIAKMLKR